MDEGPEEHPKGQCLDINFAGLYLDNIRLVTDQSPQE